MTPVTYSVPGEFTSPKFASAFAAGCRGTVARDGVLRDGPVAGFWSPALWPVLRQAQADGRTWFYGDHAYFGRGRYYRITANAYQHDGRGAADPTRWRACRRPIQRWRRRGRHVLVCPQSATYFSLFGIDVNRWIANVVETLQQHTDRPIRVRWKTDSRAVPIDRDLRDCWAVVAYSSSAALDALIAGVPVFVLADFAAASRMGTSDLTQIESPVYPDDREAFFGVLAANQWTLDEMLAGRAWEALMAGEVAHV